MLKICHKNTIRKLQFPNTNFMCTREARWKVYRDDFTGWNRFIYSFTRRNLLSLRNDFAKFYIYGSGYEIGAQNAPLQCGNKDTRIAYIDYLDKADSACKYNIPEVLCVDIDILCDANKLNCIEPETASFVIANHVLEHSPNPLGALLEWLRIVRTGGVLFFTLPNYRCNEFDFEKRPVNIEHLIDDYHNDGIRDISEIHIEEHVTIVDGISRNDTELFKKRKKEILESNLHTHYHVFDQKLVQDMLNFVHARQHIKTVNMLAFQNGFEFLYILQKVGSSGNETLVFRPDYPVYLKIMLTNMARYWVSRLRA